MELLRMTANCVAVSAAGAPKCRRCWPCPISDYCQQANRALIMSLRHSVCMAASCAIGPSYASSARLAPKWRRRAGRRPCVMVKIGAPGCRWPRARRAMRRIRGLHDAHPVAQGGYIEMQLLSKMRNEKSCRRCQRVGERNREESRASCIIISSRRCCAVSKPAKEAQKYRPMSSRIWHRPSRNGQ